MCIRLKKFYCISIEWASYIAISISMIYGLGKSGGYFYLLAFYKGTEELEKVSKIIPVVRAVLISELLLFLAFVFATILMFFGIKFKNLEFMKPWLIFTTFLILGDYIHAVYLLAEGYVLFGVISLIEPIIGIFVFVIIYSQYKNVEEFVLSSQISAPAEAVVISELPTSS
ncbi:uncharacterized protein LOC111627994 [Centruroides sculpturatus]|uniref:uncharacterized protein LOC111627994 n=1 Tax=Centruroides sculpturatus TaxID=218467 RepID=UPI000C6DCD20|nr:uncharacterized protein LOC111627994 [Centruroides sculpturatus]XP_023227474.1 uncharacterized protein LOC111627994 [Centruroides sculpturatus]